MDLYSRKILIINLTFNSKVIQVTVFEYLLSNTVRKGLESIACQRKIMVNQKNFKVTITKKRVTRLQRLHQVATNSASIALQLRLYRRLRHALTDYGLLMLRSMRISGAMFNLNGYSDEESLREFLFRRHEIPTIMNLLNWTSGVTKRSRYVCDIVNATCILLQRLSYPERWASVEAQFGMHASALSEVFYECAWSLYDKHYTLVTTFHTELMTQRAHRYAESVVVQDGLLDKCVAFIDGTKIKIARPG